MICKYCGKTIKVAGENCPGCGKKIEALQGGDGYFGVVREMAGVNTASSGRFDIPSPTNNGGMFRNENASPNDNALRGDIKRCESEVGRLQATVANSANQIEKNRRSLTRVSSFQIAFIIITLLLIGGMVIALLKLNNLSVDSSNNKTIIDGAQSEIATVKEEVQSIKNDIAQAETEEETPDEAVAALSGQALSTVEGMDTRVAFLESSEKVIKNDIATLKKEAEDLLASIEGADPESIERECNRIISGLNDAEAAFEDYEKSLASVKKDCEHLASAITSVEGGAEVTEDQVAKTDNDLRTLESNGATFDALCMMYGSEITFLDGEIKDLLED